MEPRDAPEEGTSPRERKSAGATYKPPELVCYGTLAELTQDGGQLEPDDFLYPETTGYKPATF